MNLRTRIPGHNIAAHLSRRGVAPALAIALMAALTAWVFRRQLFDQWSFPWDFLGSYSTAPAYVAATIARGHPLDWSPFVASGLPVDVDIQAGVYFPVWWLLGALHVPLTLGVLTTVQVVHVLFGAVGVTMLARVRRLPWIWATVAGVAYVFFGGFYGQAEHADMFRGYAYLPWLLWALTPPEGSRRWTRLAAVPPLAWLIATGGYQAQIVSFGIAALVYVVVALRADGSSMWRRHRAALALAAIASAAVCLAVLLPYLRAEEAGEVVRAALPTVSFRAKYAISPLDVFGLYLNNFAWTAEGTITTWAIGIPILVGLACARRGTFARHAPLVACGAVALACAMAPKNAFIGRAMLSLGPLFPSRFPGSDYKAIVAVALIVMSADSWSRIAARDRPPWLAVGLAACVLAAGAVLVPRTYAQPTQALWLVFAVIAASGALAIVRPSSRVLACVLVVLVVVDGVREIDDYLVRGVASPWLASPSTLAYYRGRDEYVRELPGRLLRAPATRPARVPAFPVPGVDASGWVADAYQATDYDAVRERTQQAAESNPEWWRLLLAPWWAATFPCASVGCGSDTVHLPPPDTWRVSSGVHTISYGAEKIIYAVKLSQPALMVENELAVGGWSANTHRVASVKSGTPFRAWRLSAGDYEFTASFHEPGRPLQYLVAAIALIAWLACMSKVLSRAHGASRRRLRARSAP